MSVLDFMVYFIVSHYVCEYHFLCGSGRGLHGVPYREP